MMKSNFQTQGAIQNALQNWKAYSCTSCGKVVTAWSPSANGPVSEHFPHNQLISEDIPDRPRQYLQQAHDSLHAPAGAVMLAASAVDAMLKSKGLTEGNLYPRIKQAEEKHIITAEMAQWAHDVRLDANDQRHADENSTLPNYEDAKRAFDFALALAELLFVLPSKVRRGLSQ
ncbi:DUF4145 domain-containing protein [Vibrio fluvialis]